MSSGVVQASVLVDCAGGHTLCHPALGGDLVAAADDSGRHHAIELLKALRRDSLKHR